MEASWSERDSSGDVLVFVKGVLVMKKRKDRSRGPTLLFQVAPSQTVELTSRP